MRLGICDWGVGGFGLYTGLKSVRPDIGFAYIGDQASEPYSLMSREMLTARIEQITLTFRRMGVERVVFACDTASTVLSDISVPGVTLSGVIDPTLRAMRHKRFKEVGVVGGRRTILSGAYGRALRKQRFCVLQRVSLDLSVEIENGRANEPQTRTMIEEMLEPLAKADCILLASTHYPAISSTINEILPRAEIVNPIEETLHDLVKTLPAPEGECLPDAFYTTGDTSAMRLRVADLFGLNIDVQGLEIAGPDVDYVGTSNHEIANASHIDAACIL